MNGITTTRTSGHAPLVVLHAAPGVWLDQTQTWLYEQVRHLPASIDSHIVCSGTRNLDQFALPNIHALRQRSGARRLLERGMHRLGMRLHAEPVAQLARRLGARVLHSHFGPTGWRHLQAARLAGLRHIVTFYGLDVGYLPAQGWAGRYAELFQSADRVLCEGPHMARQVVELGCPETIVEVHRLGVRVDEIEFKPRHWDGTSPLRVLMAASFREKKGYPVAIEALGCLNRRVPLALTIIGDADDSPRGRQMRSVIRRALRTHGLAGRTRLLGYQPHHVVFREAGEHHVFLAPSMTSRDGDTEGGAPVVLIEMAATGIPIVTTAHCDIPSIIQHGTSGFLAREGDVDSLLDCLIDAVDSRGRWQELVACAREHVAAHFDARTQGVKLAEIYAKLARPVKAAA